MCMEEYIRHQKQLLLRLPVLSHSGGPEWGMCLLLSHYRLK